MTDLPLLRLVRLQQLPDGTFGEMRLPRPWDVLQTCEDDWQNNARGVSCIPAGAYLIQRSFWQKHQMEVFEVTGVPGRTRILIHPGNTEEDTEGCILVGMRRGRLLVEKDEDTGLPKVMKEAVVDSRHAFHDVFMAALSRTDTAMLSISWAQGLPLGGSEAIS